MWIHWWSPVASAKVFTRSWVISIQSLVPSSWPLREGSSAMVVVVVLMRGSPRWERGGCAGRAHRSCRLRSWAARRRNTTSPEPQGPDRVLLHDQRLDLGLDVQLLEVGEPPLGAQQGVVGAEEHLRLQQPVRGPD